MFILYYLCDQGQPDTHIEAVILLKTKNNIQYKNGKSLYCFKSGEIFQESAYVCMYPRAFFQFGTPIVPGNLLWGNKDYRPSSKFNNFFLSEEDRCWKSRRNSDIYSEWLQCDFIQVVVLKMDLYSVRDLQDFYSWCYED